LKGSVVRRWRGGDSSVRWLVLAIAFIAVFRLALYVTQPEFVSDFDILYHAAVHFLRGEDPYPITHQWSYYPLYYPFPAVILAMPFSVLPLEPARAAFDIVVGSAFAYALWRHRRPHGLLAVVSGAYLFALRNGQMTPLVVAAALIPALSFLLVVKPNTGLALWIWRPQRVAVIGGLVMLATSLVLLPAWPLEWWQAIQVRNEHLVPPLFRPFGFLLLLALLRWRTPEGRLLLASAIIPQNVLPHELVPLALIPSNTVEMGIYIAGTWLTLFFAGRAWGIPDFTVAGLNAASWPAILLAVYLPMLYLVLKKPGGPKLLPAMRSSSRD
jgi:hypothetical protein